MTVRELITKLSFHTDEASLKKSEARSKALMTGLKVAAVGVVVGIAAIGKKAVSAAADMEMLTTQFEVMLGSSEKANVMMSDLKQFAASTPFALNDLAKGSQNLLAFGIKNEDVIKTMRMLGDTAGGSAEKLNGLVMAYGKIAVEGKASGETLKMMAERGLPIYDTLAEQMGVSRAQLTGLISQGKVSQENVTKAFEAMTSSGGMFYQGMEKQSLTLHGLISTMKDNFNLLLADVGTTLLPVMKELNTVLIELSQGAIKNLVTSIVQNLVPIVQLFADMLPRLIEVLIPVFDALSAILAPIIQILGEILPVVFEVLFSVITPLVDVLKAVLIPVIAVLKPILMLVVNNIKLFASILVSLLPLIGMLGLIFKAFAPVIERLCAPWQKLGTMFTGMLIPIIQSLLPLFKVVIDLIVMLLPLIEIFTNLLIALTPAIEIVGKIIAWFVNILVKILVPVFQFLGMVIGWVIKGITAVGDAFVWLIKKVLSLLPASWFGGDKSKSKGDGVPARPPQSIEELTGRIKIPAIGSTDSLKAGGGSSKISNVAVNNNITVSGDSVANPAATKATMQAIAESVFTIQLKKVLVDSEV